MIERVDSERVRVRERGERERGEKVMEVRTVES